MKKAASCMSLAAFIGSYGRCERIRTFDPLHPMQVRYQAAPHTEALNYSRLKSVTRAEQLTNFVQFAPQVEQLRQIDGAPGCLGALGRRLDVVLQRGIELLLIDLDRLHALERN